MANSSLQQREQVLGRSHGRRQLLRQPGALERGQRRCALAGGGPVARQRQQQRLRRLAVAARCNRRAAAQAAGGVRRARACVEASADMRAVSQPGAGLSRRRVADRGPTRSDNGIGISQENQGRLFQVSMLAACWSRSGEAGRHAHCGLPPRTVRAGVPAAALRPGAGERRERIGLVDLANHRRAARYSPRRLLSAARGVVLGCFFC